MAEYLTEAAYQRWLRQYQANIGIYINLVYQLRIRLDALSDTSELQKIESMMDDIDERLEKAIPRNFSANEEPLIGLEMFVENIKVLLNFGFRISGGGDYYLGIYQAEKNRIAVVHQEFKFKEKLKQVREMIEAMEQKEQQVMDEVTLSPLTASVAEFGA